MKIALVDNREAHLAEWQVTLNDDVQLVYREWTDPGNGLVEGYSLATMDGEIIRDEQLIEMIQFQVEENLFSRTSS